MNSTLNGSSGLSAEAANVVREVNVALTTNDYYLGGMPRSVLGEFNGSSVAAYYYAFSASLDLIAADLYFSDEPYGAYAADWILNASDDLFYFDEDWCRAVNSSAGSYGVCGPNDELVPVWSQRSAAGTEVDVSGAPVHLSETDIGAAVIGPVFETYFGLSRH
ncbi:MAG: hypothetical protein ABJE10_00430 [bacterium]